MVEYLPQQVQSVIGVPGRCPAVVLEPADYFDLRNAIEAPGTEDRQQVSFQIASEPDLRGGLTAVVTGRRPGAGDEIPEEWRGVA